MTAKASGPKARQRVDTDTNHLTRGPDGSAFIECPGCHKSVAAALVSFHNCKEAELLKVKLAKLAEEQVEIRKEHEEEKHKRKRVAPENKDEVDSSDLKKKKKRKKAPTTAIKKPMTAYMLWLADFRPKYKEEHPDCKATDVLKEAGPIWKALSEEEKKPYEEKAAELKAQYEEALKGDAQAAALEGSDETNGEPDAGEEADT